MIEVIKGFFESQWGGMISGLLTSAFIALLKLLFDYIATTKSEYSGAWIDAVYDKDNNIEKVDVWKLRYNNHSKKVKGHVKRYCGEGENREWKCVGQILDHTFYLIYEGLGEYSHHNGCVVAKVKDECKKPFRMQADGRYIKKNETGGDQSVKITLYKLSKENLTLIKKEGIKSFFTTTEPYKKDNQLMMNILKKIWVDMDSAVEYVDLQDAYLRSKSIRNNAIFIVKDDYAVADLTQLLAKSDVRNYQIYTVKAVKGLEFEEVFVFDADMTANEKYISYTRALNKLNVIKSLPKVNTGKKDLIIQGEDVDEIAS